MKNDVIFKGSLSGLLAMLRGLWHRVRVAQPLLEQFLMVL
jgi:hypothetical protein